MKSQRNAVSLPGILCAVAAALLAPTVLLWVCVLLSSMGIELSLPAKCCCGLSGFGGVIFFLALPLLALIVSLSCYAALKLGRRTFPLHGFVAAIGSAVLIVLALAVCAQGT